MVRGKRPQDADSASQEAVSLSTGAAAGLVGGIVASWLMVAFQTKVWPPPRGSDGEPSTDKLARKLVAMTGSRPLTGEQARTAGKAIHYTLGAGLGLLYGAGASLNPRIAMGAGMPFGIMTEIVIDQTVVPAFGLSNPFWKCPAEWSVRGLAAHLVFGFVTETSRRILLRGPTHRVEANRRDRGNGEVAQ